MKPEKSSSVASKEKKDQIASRNSKLERSSSSESKTTKIQQKEQNKIAQHKLGNPGKESKFSSSDKVCETLVDKKSGRSGKPIRRSSSTSSSSSSSSSESGSGSSSDSSSSGSSSSDSRNSYASNHEVSVQRKKGQRQIEAKQTENTGDRESPANSKKHEKYQERVELKTDDKEKRYEKNRSGGYRDSLVGRTDAGRSGYHEDRPYSRTEDARRHEKTDGHKSLKSEYEIRGHKEIYESKHRDQSLGGREDKGYSDEASQQVNRDSKYESKEKSLKSKSDIRDFDKIREPSLSNRSVRDQMQTKERVYKDKCYSEDSSRGESASRHVSRESERQSGKISLKSEYEHRDHDKIREPSLVNQSVRDLKQLDERDRKDKFYLDELSQRKEASWRVEHVSREEIRKSKSDNKDHDKIREPSLGNRSVKDLKLTDERGHKDKRHSDESSRREDALCRVSRESERESREMNLKLKSEHRDHDKIREASLGNRSVREQKLINESGHKNKYYSEESASRHVSQESEHGSREKHLKSGYEHKDHDKVHEPSLKSEYEHRDHDRIREPSLKSDYEHRNDDKIHKSRHRDQSARDLEQLNERDQKYMGYSESSRRDKASRDNRKSEREASEKNPKSEYDNRDHDRIREPSLDNRSVRDLKQVDERARKDKFYLEESSRREEVPRHASRTKSEHESMERSPKIYSEYKKEQGKGYIDQEELPSRKKRVAEDSATQSAISAEVVMESKHSRASFERELDEDRSQKYKDPLKDDKHRSTRSDRSVSDKNREENREHYARRQHDSKKEPEYMKMPATESVGKSDVKESRRRDESSKRCRSPDQVNDEVWDRNKDPKRSRVDVEEKDRSDDQILSKYKETDREILSRDKDKTRERSHPDDDIISKKQRSLHERDRGEARTSKARDFVERRERDEPVLSSAERLNARSELKGSDFGYEDVSDDDFEDLLYQDDEDEKRVAKNPVVDLLDIDWKSLVKDDRSKNVTRGSVLNRFSSRSIFSKIGISHEFAGENLVNKVKEVCTETKVESFPQPTEDENFKSGEIRDVDMCEDFVSSYRIPIYVRSRLSSGLRQALCRIEKTIMFPAQFVDPDLYNQSLELMGYVKNPDRKPFLELNPVLAN